MKTILLVLIVVLVGCRTTKDDATVILRLPVVPYASE